MLTGEMILEIRILHRQGLGIRGKRGLRPIFF